MAKKKLSKDAAFAILWNNGFFYGWEKIVKDYEPEAREGAEYKAFLYKTLLKKIIEAKKEVKMLESSLIRLEATCRAGTSPNIATANLGWDNNYVRLRDELKAFSGWTVSFIESHQTLLHYIQNPESAGLSMRNLQEGMADLARKRAEARSLLTKAPELFTISLFYP